MPRMCRDYLTRLLAALRGGVVLPFLLAAIFLAAAGLKWHVLASGAELHRSESSRWFQTAIIEGEIVLAVWLFLGRSPRVARQLALASFSVFLSVNIFQALAGKGSCGCFGKLAIHPGNMIGFDLALIAAAWCWRPGNRTAGSIRSYTSGSRVVGVPASLLILGLALGWSVGGFRKVVVISDDEISADVKIVLLEPETWVGRQLPVLSYLDVPADLTRGEWIVVFHRQNCAKCRNVIPTYEQLAHAADSPVAAPRVALIEVPPFTDGGSIQLHSHGASGRLSTAREWFVTTPAVLSLKDGLVMSHH